MKLSIIVTNYNYGHFLEQAISSLFKNKNLDFFEVLLVDDGSTDNSAAVIEKLLRQFPSIRFFQHEKNLGQAAALDTAFAQMRGEYLHPFAADDVMLPGAIDIMLDHFIRFPEIPCFTSDNAYFHLADPEPLIEISKTIDAGEFHFFSSHDVYKLFAHTDFWIPGQTIFAKTEIYLKYAPFDKKLQFIMDWWVNHLMAIQEGIGYIPTAISAQRKHATSFSSAIDTQRKIDVWIYLFQLLETNPEQLKPLYQSGVFRMFGIKAIYRKLITTPKYWKYFLPMFRKIAEKKTANILAVNCDQYWLKRTDAYKNLNAANQID